MPRHACFLHIVTTISVLSRAFGLLHNRTAPHFVLDNALAHGANRLLILALLPIRAHAFQSNRCNCPEMKPVALPGEMCCQSPCLIMSYYPLCPQTEREPHQCLCDHDQYIITFLSPQWHYQGTVQLHRPAILEKKVWLTISLT